MCKICVRFGRERIEDQEVLSKAIAEVARAMELMPSATNHYLDFLDDVLDGREVDEIGEQVNTDPSNEDQL